MSTKKLIAVGFVLFTLLAADLMFAQRSREVTVPEGSRIRLRFDKALSSQTSQHGEKFTATVIEPVSANNRVVVPRGSKIEGMVTVAEPAKRGVIGVQRKEGELDVRWDSLVLPNGVRKGIAAHAVALDDPKNKGQIKNEEGTMKGESSTKRDVLQTGIGTGVGAAIGAIAGGGKGTAIGAAVGGLAGLGTSALRKGHDIEIKEGTKIIIQLDRPMNFITRELTSDLSENPSAFPYQEGTATSQRRGRRVKPARQALLEDKTVEEGFRFGEQDATIIREFFAVPANLPPGLAKRRGDLPPGLKKQLVRRGHLPPGLQKRLVPFPEELESRLPSLPDSTVRVILGRDALLINEESNLILDILHDIH